MYNEKLTWNEGKTNWDYSPVKYWPNGTDTANKDGEPSNTATQSQSLYLSFFGYAPYTSIEGDAYDPATDGAFPTSPAVGAAKKTGNDEGIIAVSTNEDDHDIQLKYAFKEYADERNAVDMLWGLRGQEEYSETDASNPKVSPLGTAYNTDLTKQTVNEKVKFLFKHALARVGGNTSSATAGGVNQICGLKAVVDVDANNTTAGSGLSHQTNYFSSDFDKAKTLVTISSVKIRDAYTYSQEPNSTITTTVSDFLTWGWFDIMSGQWTFTGTDANLISSPIKPGAQYNIEANNSGTPYGLNPAIKEPEDGNTTISTIVKSGTHDAFVGNGTATPTGVNLTAENVYADQNVPGLLLIPGGTNTNTLYITVNYTVRTADPKLSGYYTTVTQEITNKVTLDGASLAPNKYYSLVMHLGLTSVKFEAVVSDWAGNSDTYDENGAEITPGTGVEESVWLPSNVVEPINRVKTVNINASATSSGAITIDGLTAGNTVSITSVSGNIANTSNVTLSPATVPAGGAVNATATLTANTLRFAKTSTFVVTEKNGDNVISTTTVNVIQAASALTFSPVSKVYEATATATGEVPFTSVTDANSTDVKSTSTYSTLAPWLTLNTTTGAVTFGENTTIHNRIAEITATANGATGTFTLTQKPVALVISPAVTAGDADVTLTVTTPNTNLGATPSVTAKDDSDNDVPITSVSSSFDTDHTDIVVTLNTAPSVGDKITFTVSVGDATGTTGQITVQ